MGRDHRNLRQFGISFQRWFADNGKATVILRGEPAEFAGLELVKTFVFAPDSIRVTTKIVNRDQAPRRVEYRFRSFAYPRKGKVEVLFGGERPPDERSSFFRCDPHFSGRPFGTVPVAISKECGLEIGVSGVKRRMRIDCPEVPQPGGIYFWTSASSPAFTAEAIYASETVRPDKSVSRTMRITFR